MTYEDPIRNANSSEFEVNKKAIFQFIMSRLMFLVGGPFPLDEMMLMVATVCRFKPEFIIEWGTHFGYSARIFHETIQAFGLNSQIHSIDLPDDVAHIEHDIDNVGTLIRDIETIKLHRGDGVTVALDLIEEYQTSGNILFFVDGDHSFESVSRELTAIIEKVKNPIILIHDIFYQSSDANYNIGPILAANEILTSKKWICKKMDLGLPGMLLCYNESNLTKD